ncbi:MAG: hypothetical protein G01um101419_208 [Parcubacteria group bacterium Gr01-1014_19]|nr:MAG: hypothetical protein G01um101419_208 [Parcubacteria group bacterium Gr01-1014_19]
MDGNLSAIYRVSGHLGGDVQKRVGEIIVSYFEPILVNKSWDYNFTHKSTTITSLHQLLEETLKAGQPAGLVSVATSQIFVALREMQLVRKNMVALREERMPKSEWILIYFLAAIFLVIVAVTIPSQYLLLSAVLKAAFVTSMLFVAMLLRQLDNLKFFEGTIGESSARDMLAIIKGDR